MAYSEFKSDELILRDLLARDRTILANERTFLAYVRTSLMFCISGATIVKLFERTLPNMVCGYGLIAAGILTIIIGTLRFRSVKRDMDRISDKQDGQRTGECGHPT